MESLRREVDRLFEEFGGDFWRFPFHRRASMLEPFWRGEEGLAAPAVDIVEGEKAYEVTAELPGMDDKDIEVTLTDDVLTIKGEKREDKEEKEKNYRLSERGIRSGCVVAASLEEIFTFGGFEEFGAAFEEGDEAGDGALGELSQNGLQFGEGLLDGVEVR